MDTGLQKVLTLLSEIITLLKQESKKAYKMYLYIALNFILFVLNKNEIKYHITI